ncbi:Holliday junction branch migration protein RuvA [Psychrobium sp. 1_MG-2023]|uniref:Holliday junction branch migration protein RuvA n=1 Tax=Psychrobium sp. 1_MG-2023 TaxID=3062624 RepID=UPI000C32F956|nr:Holliday junction branch migration protein RuvA [Psychrobium sp. 1_MG-2023]MDP2560248.1 Holliday junction branch migration protein RuvA [Psychrobium sp. 1_MG-2023]PKF57058.1 Holliday junction branch migration protein RuvA [Alteromonadales bacterium alter-6D02]
MIGRLNGIVAEKQAPLLLLEVSGIGYEVQMPMTSFYQMPEVGEQVIIHTHFVVREDAQLLYGFANKIERELFREIIKANGVGPKLGLAILSGLSASQFVQIVSNSDASALVKLPGIGLKTAERLIIELKDRLKNFTLQQQDSLATDAQPLDGDLGSTFIETVDVEQDAIDALLALGYKQNQATKIVKKVKLPEMDSEALIKAALKAML